MLKKNQDVSHETLFKVKNKKNLCILHGQVYRNAKEVEWSIIEILLTSNFHTYFLYADKHNILQSFFTF